MIQSSLSWLMQCSRNRILEKWRRHNTFANLHILWKWGDFKEETSALVLWKERQSSIPWLFRGVTIIGIRGQSKIMQRPSLKEFRRIFFFLPTDGVVNSQNILSRAIRKLLSVILNGTLVSEVSKEEKSLWKAPNYLLYVFQEPRIRNLYKTLAPISAHTHTHTQRICYKGIEYFLLPKDGWRTGYSCYIDKDNFSKSPCTVDPVYASILSSPTSKSRLQLTLEILWVY